MKTPQLLALIFSEGAPASETLPLELRRAFFKLHDHLPELQLRNGKPIRDVVDVMELCREIIDHLQPEAREKQRT